MGNRKSGNRIHWRRWPKKTTVEDCWCIDANGWARASALRPDVLLSGAVTWPARRGVGVASIAFDVDTTDPAAPWAQLTYSIVGNRVNELVGLVTTRPNFGGRRWWFTCPTMGCGRRVGKLYLPPNGRHFGCRSCHGLTYTSSQEAHKFDAMFRLLAIRLGWEPNEVRRALTGRVVSVW